MALFIVNTFITAADYVRTTPYYSNTSSLWRAIQNGHQPARHVGGITLIPMPPESVAKVYGISTWQGLAVTEHLPAGLEVLSTVRKKTGIPEATILGWAQLNRIDAYWVGGHYATTTEKVQLLAKEEKIRQVNLNIPRTGYRTKKPKT